MAKGGVAEEFLVSGFSVGVATACTNPIDGELSAASRRFPVALGVHIRRERRAHVRPRTTRTRLPRTPRSLTTPAPPPPPPGPPGAR